MAITPGGGLNITPSAIRTTLASNYLDFTSDAGNNGWQQQYLPDLMEKEAEIFGKRTIAGFLSQVGAEEAMSSDQVVWSEQGRLHLTYTATANSAAGQVVTITDHIDTGAVYAANSHGIRKGDTVLLAHAGGTIRCYVSDADSGTDNNITCLPYDSASLTGSGMASGSDVACRVMVYGSEFAKGTSGQTEANKPSFKSYSNKPIIVKDMYMVNGSDVSAIGWVEVTGEEGQNGYLWYLKAEGDTRARFTDHLEMTLVEAEKALTGSTIHDNGHYATAGVVAAETEVGTEGLFSAISNRGNKASGLTGVNASTDLAEFDAILAEFDKQGAIEENMMFINRATSLAMDDMLASMNGYGAGGTSYGVFNNSEDMALNLGFSGFRRGSYDFYKTDWKYLNDKGTRGSINAIDAVSAVRGVMIPAGVSSVYDEQLGKNLKRPFLHVRYRASQMESRKFKTWTTGSVGAETSDLDAMKVHYLSERCLVVQGANNFMLLN
jgi:hypothetical protein|tara:strand:+ start:4626 stop:6104 length:1479 start_codon:yes stop_codon:yes gene_type:complete